MVMMMMRKDDTMTISRFEACYFEGEDNERLPEWSVVEWDNVVYNEDGSVKSKSGRKVWTSHNMIFGEEEAVAMAEKLNEEYYNWVQNGGMQ